MIWYEHGWHSIFDGSTTALERFKFLAELLHFIGPFVVAIYAAVINVPHYVQLIMIAVGYFAFSFFLTILVKQRQRKYELASVETHIVQATRAWEVALKSLEKFVDISDNSEDERTRFKVELANWMINTLALKFQVNSSRFSISVFMTDGHSGSFVACARAPTDDEKDDVVKIEGSVLHAVVEKKQAVIVPNTHWSFHPFNMTQQMARTEKSKVLIPLTKQEQRSKERKCWGVISIECDTPFFFRSRDSRDILRTLLPLTSMIRMITRPQEHYK